MSLIDVYNIENYTPKPQTFSWYILLGTLVGFLLAVSSQVVQYYMQVYRSGKLFRIELEDSENPFWKQLLSLHNFKQEITENRKHNLTLYLKQRFKTVLAIDRARLIAYYKQRLYLWLWWRGRESNYVTNTLGQIENTVIQMERLDKVVTDFNTQYTKYMLEYVDLHYNIKYHYDTLKAKGKTNSTMIFFAASYQQTFFQGPELKDRKIIDIALLETTAMPFHLMLEDKMPYDKDEEFFNKAMEYSYKSRAIISHLNHSKRQVLADVSLIETTLSETYEELYSKKFDKDKNPEK